LILALLCVVGSPAPSVADDLHPHARAGATVYSESMHTSVVSTYASAGARLPGELEAELDWSADIISSASVDVITAATDRVEERRNQFGATLSRESLATDFDLSAGYTFSFEHDSYAHVAHVEARQGFLEDNLALELSYGLSYNRLGMRGEPRERWRQLWVHTLDVGMMVVLDPRTEMELIYSGGLSDGYLASRYRRVPITFRQDLRQTAWVDEAVPDTRIRHAITLRGARALSEHWIGRASYRFYWDGWGITGHTVELAASVALPGHITLSGRARGAQQSGASFYEPVYASLSRYRTRDRRLSRHLAGSAGLAATLDLSSYVDFDGFELRASADGVLYSFHDYVLPRLDDFGGADWAELGEIRGLIVQLQLKVRR